MPKTITPPTTLRDMPNIVAHLHQIRSGILNTPEQHRPVNQDQLNLLDTAIAFLEMFALGLINSSTNNTTTKNQ